MAGVTAIQGVDDTLRDLSVAALSGLVPTTAVTVGPLDRDDDRSRLNWFLYRISPNAAFSNMEPPRTGSRTARGRPPLALELHYLLSAHAGPLTSNGDEDQFCHRALAAVMRALHDDGVIGEGDPNLSNLAKPLVEPLRVTLVSLDLDGLSKMWTAASQPLRLSVAYQVSLVIVDSAEAHVAGPPVLTRRVDVAPTLGPRLVSVSPERISAGVEFTVAAEGLTAATAFSLAREPGDPPGPAGGWPLTLVSSGPGQVRLRLTSGALPPGRRRIEAVATDAGLPVGRGSIGLSVAPTIAGPAGPVAAGATVSLTTAHATADVEVFLRGRRVPPSAAVFVSATQVDVTVAAGTPAGPLPAALRAGRVAGPVFSGLVVP